MMEDRGCLYHVCVDVNHRMRGIGKAMVVFTMEALKKEGINKVSLIAFHTERYRQCILERNRMDKEGRSELLRFYTE